MLGVDLECQKLLLFGLVCQFAYAQQSLDYSMRLEIQQLDPYMAVLQGKACRFFSIGAVPGKIEDVRHALWLCAFTAFLKKDNTFSPGSI